MLGSYETARRWNEVERLAKERQARENDPAVFYVRCGNGDVASGPFTLAEASERAFRNMLEFGARYEVIRPETDEKGVRTYVATVVASYTPGE